MPYFRPWLFLISDGAPTDPDWIQAAEAARLEESVNGVSVFPIGVERADLGNARHVQQPAVASAAHQHPAISKFVPVVVRESRCRGEFSAGRNRNAAKRRLDHDRSDMTDRGPSEAWSYVGASVTGTAHLARDRPCQEHGGLPCSRETSW